MCDAGRIKTLQLVTTQRPFFEQQVEALERHGIDCTVVSVPRPDAGGRSVRDYLQFQLRTLRETVSGDFDLVHANYGLTAPAALTQPRRPVVLSLWGSDVFGTYSRVSRICAGLSDAVIVMSEGMAETLDRPCHVVPHGVDMQRFRPESTRAARARIGWQHDVRYVLFPYDPAREVKNFDRAERVVDAADGRVDAPVCLQAVHGVAHDTVPRYMNAADALLLTSEHEGSPNAVKEAMACNLPVVSVAVGDVPELLGDTDASYVCHSDDELVERLAAVLRETPRSDGRTHVTPYSLRRMGADLQAIYEAQLNEGFA